jgi:phosphoglycerate dehydrogenase-like enzyme
MLNSKTIGLMKPDAIVINTARGKLIDEIALYEALQNGRIAYAGLDVHYEEPMTNDDPFKRLDNVILTPHIAGLSFETFRYMMSDAVGNITLFQKGDIQLLENKKIKI